MKRRSDYKPKPARSCERCATPLVPRVYSSGEEEYGLFMRRKFCSLICANSRGKKGTSRTQMMVQARTAALGATCECCGGTERLSIHHVNEDWRDNQPQNWQTLCVYCHQQWHGLHRRLGIRCSTPMPPLASLSVKTSIRIHWGSFDPSRASPCSAPMATASTRRPQPPSSER